MAETPWFEAPTPAAPPGSGELVVCTLELRGHGTIPAPSVTGLRNRCRDLFLACEAEGIPLTGGFQPALEQTAREAPAAPKSALATELGI